MEDLNLSLLRKDRHSLISSNVPAMTKLYKNVLNPAIAKYAGLGPELQAYLRERYGEGIDFKVTHENDRWHFRAPERLTSEELRDMTLEILDRKKEADARAAEQEGKAG
ncbi:hypothetical protein VTN96DRAFT_4844 [Rasamsonia emersonii]